MSLNCRLWYKSSNQKCYDGANKKFDLDSERVERVLAENGNEVNKLRGKQKGMPKHPLD